MLPVTACDYEPVAAAAVRSVHSFIHACNHAINGLIDSLMMTFGPISVYRSDNGGEVVVDETSDELITRCSVDYVDELIGSAFKVRTCGVYLCDSLCMRFCVRRIVAPTYPGR
eukprot:GHVU01223648.1.p1 GENE.GHVU01223648.1~~GHVU01223648.1.p1  ORF type:complete len:113 (-),score=13.20 GHVU01223648.1:145-483(-)